MFEQSDGLCFNRSRNGGKYLSVCLGIRWNTSTSAVVKVPNFHTFHEYPLVVFRLTGAPGGHHLGSSGLEEYQRGQEL